MSRSDGLPSSVLPSTVPHFTGRQDECAEIVHQLTNTATRIVGIVGSPGFGKTSIAKTVCHQITSSRPGSHVYFVPLQGLTSLESLAKKLLTILNPSILASLEKASGHVSAIDQLQDFVKSVRQSICLCLDNADTFVESSNGEFLQLIAGLAKFGVHTRILYTSRKTLKFSGLYVQTKVIQIQELTRNEGADLVNSLVPDLPREDAIKLSELCGDVPLALHLLCSTLQEDHITVEELVASREDLFGLLDTTDIPDEFRFRNLFDDSFGRLSESAQNSFRLLAVFKGSFDAEAASAVLDVNGIPLKKALAELEARSLLEYDKASKRYRLHPLLYSYCLLKCEDSEETQAAYRDATHRSHRYFLELFQKLNSGYQGNDWQSVVESFEKERSNIYDTLTRSVRLDEWYGKVNDEVVKSGVEFFLEYVLSHREYERLYVICLEEANKRNDKIRRNQILLSQFFSELLLQDFNNSCSFPVPVAEVLGITKGKLLCYKGIFLANQKKLEEGLELIQEGIRQIDASGGDPVVTSLSLYILACIYRKKENYQQATLCQKKAEKECVIHGLPTIQTEDLDTSSSRVANLQDTIETDEQKMAGQEEGTRASVNHPLSAQFCTIFNVIPAVSGDLDGTLNVLYRILDVRKRKLGEDSRTADCYRNISSILTLKGEPDIGFKMAKEALRIEKAISGNSQHPGNLLGTAEAYYTIGGALFAMGDSGAALKAYGRSVEVRDETNYIPVDQALEGTLHSCKETDTSTKAGNAVRKAHSYKRMHHVYFQEGKWTESFDVATKALQITEMWLGNHEDTARAHCDVGNALQKMGNCEGAVEEYRKAFEIHDEVVGRTAESAKFFLEIAEKMLEMEEHLAAVDLPKHVDTAESYNKLGCILLEMKDSVCGSEADRKWQEIIGDLLRIYQKVTQTSYGLDVALFKSGNTARSMGRTSLLDDVWKALRARGNTIFYFLLHFTGRSRVRGV